MGIRSHVERKNNTCMSIFSDLGSIYVHVQKKGADQLCLYHTADLRLCFCIFKNQVFS